MMVREFDKSDMDIEKSVLEQCSVRGNAWGLEVNIGGLIEGLMTCHNLFAEESVYHKNCHQFLQKKHVCKSW